jgi:DNA primase
VINFYDLRDTMSNNRHIIDDIKERFSVSSVIGESVRLIGRDGKYMACCPFHDDSTPSMSVRDDIGRFHCFGCGARGDVIDYVMQREGCTLREACQKLDDGYAPAGAVRPTTVESDAERSRVARNIWNACGPIEGTPAADYLEKRALPVEFASQQENLRFGRLSFDHSAKKHPALVAAARDSDGEIVAIQRIFLTEKGFKLSADCKRSLGPCKGAAIRLTSLQAPVGSSDHVYVCEGLEDGLTMARMQQDAVVYVTMGAANLASVDLPAGCKKVTIACDNDEAGNRATEIATAAYVKMGMEVEVTAPPPQFKDWNAYLVYWEFEYRNLFGNDLPWRYLDEHDLYNEDGEFVDADNDNDDQPGDQGEAA